MAAIECRKQMMYRGTTKIWPSNSSSNTYRRPSLNMLASVFVCVALFSFLHHIPIHLAAELRFMDLLRRGICQTSGSRWNNSRLSIPFHHTTSNGGLDYSCLVVATMLHFNVRDIPLLIKRNDVTSITILVTLIVCYLSYLLIYGLFLCPTRHLPGPFYTRYNLPYYLILFSGSGCMIVHDLHKKYGIHQIDLFLMKVRSFAYPRLWWTSVLLKQRSKHGLGITKVKLLGIRIRSLVEWSVEA